MMLQSFTIKNFRGFHNLEISPLERVNLIIGKNNVGKTALLEAIFLHIGVNNPALPLRVNVIRGIEQFTIEPKEVWGWLFPSRDIDKYIELVSIDDEKVSRSTGISLIEPETTQLVPSGNGGNEQQQSTGSLTTVAGSRELILSYHDTLGNKAKGRAFITPEGEISGQSPRLASLPTGIYLSARARFLREDAERFSKLERIGRQDEVLITLKLLEPRLRRLAVLVTGGAPIINGDIGIGELVPLPFMGEGLVRLLSILLAIANAPGGIVLVDEIENGLHHSVLNGVWLALAEAARKADVQLFITTHSWECIQAAHRAFEASGTYDFRLHRLDRIGEEVRAVTFDQKRLDVAEATDLEVR